jgi:hypothetical protein
MYAQDLEILKFNCDLKLLTYNVFNFSDNFRMLLCQKNEAIFDKLNYEDDFTFLDPALICYFFSNRNSISLEQILCGYFKKINELDTILVKSDIFGLVNFPNIGYVRTKQADTHRIEICKIQENVIPNQFVSNSKIRLCLHPTEHLEYSPKVEFNEPVEKTLNKNRDSLNQATDFFQNNLTDLWGLILIVSREFVVFSSTNRNSFASINHHGTAYFNTENRKVSSIFFIEDIAHQCGHIIFNMLTLQTNDFLTFPKNVLLKTITKQSEEQRTIYGAFHGLFTYTTIVYALSRVTDLETIFSKSDVLEAKGRLGFFMMKFSVDLVIMENPTILTNEGMRYYYMALESYKYVKEKYQCTYDTFNYDNQPYNFNFSIFKEENNF